MFAHTNKQTGVKNNTLRFYPFSIQLFKRVSNSVDIAAKFRIGRLRSASANMSLITSQKRKKNVQQGGKGGPSKKKKDKDKPMIPPPVEGGPFVPGHRLFAKSRVEKHLRPCVVIATNSVATKSVGEGEGDSEKHPFQYYVHFLEFNRRMDCWVEFENISIRNENGELPPQEEIKVGQAHAGRNNGDTVNFLEETGAESNEGMDEESLRDHETVTKVKNVAMIELGRHRMEAWYFSPFPPELFPDGDQTKPIPILYLCEFTLKFFRHKSELQRHYKKNPSRHPPGNEIYRDDATMLSMFEVDGSKEKSFAQNLSWLAKMFLDHKTLYYDVDPFLFYVLTERDDRGYHIVGFYSKEKYSESGYNLACILTLPAYQRKGYGKFLIEFSYELSKKEKKVGSPEKPLSDLGQLGYRSYWSEILLQVLIDGGEKHMSIIDLCKITSFKADDTIQTLQSLNLLKYYSGNYLIYITDEARERHKRYQERKKKQKRVDPEKIHWAPFESGRKRDQWSIRSIVRGEFNQDGDDDK